MQQQKQLPISEEMKQLLHPFMFVLNEGEETPSNGRIYSLQMLQVGHLERLKSPEQLHLFPLLNSTAQNLQPENDQ